MKRQHAFFVLGLVALVVCAALVQRPARDARWRDGFEARGSRPRLRPMALWRSREALRGLTARDPARVTLGSVARDDSGDQELHLVVRNDGRCVLRGFRATAYGFDARGEPSALERGAQVFEVTGDGLSLAPGEHTRVTTPIRGVPVASLVIGHIDALTCADGTRWSR